MPTIRRKLILAGHYAGYTGTLWIGQLTAVEFTDGATVLEGSQQDVDGFARYLGKCYQALPEDSLELAAAQKRDAEEKEKTDGELPDEPDSGDGADQDVLDVPGPAGEGSSDRPAEGDGDGDGPAEPGTEELPPEGAGDEGTETQPLTDDKPKRRRK